MPLRAPRRPLLRVHALEDRRTPAVHVAVVSGGPLADNTGFQATVDQLNDNTYGFGFSASLVDPGQLHTEAALDGYNAVVIGNTGASPAGDPFDDAAFTSALKAWARDGGGVVMTGFGVFGDSTNSPAGAADIDAVVPVNTVGGGGLAFTLTPNATPSPITAGVSSFTLTGNADYVEYPLGGADAGATVLATASGQPAVVSGSIGLGKAVYLGPIYSGYYPGHNNAELRSGFADQLLEQAVAYVQGTVAPPNIVLAPAAVAENLPAGTAVGTLTATAPNAGNNFTFTLVDGPGGADDSQFYITGNTLHTNAAFNFEAKANYDVLIHAVDENNLIIEKPLTVAVTDVPEAPTGLSISNAAVNEGQPVGTIVGSLSTTDPDAGDSFTYALVAGAGSSGNSQFTLAGNVLTTNAVFHTSAQSSYDIRVRTTDSTGNSFDQTFTVTVEPLSGAANTPPTLTGVPVSVHANEGDTIAFTAGATDPDVGQTLTFGLNGAPPAASIDPNTGAFSWATTEADGPDTFVFDVQVSDGTATTSQPVTVIIREVNQAPTLAGVPATLTVVRGQAVTFPATATDPDVISGQPNTLTFSVDGNAPTVFADPVSGVVTVRVPDTADAGDTFPATIRVRDDGVPSLGDTQTVTVTAVDAALVNGNLLIGGTAANDTIAVNPSKDGQSLVVVLNKQVVGTYPVGQVSRIVVHGLGGNDKITVSPKVTVGADLYGDAGNDALTGGAGDDVQVGGSGNDKLAGGLGRNILIGGTGSDKLTGGKGDDLLIGGTTAFDTDPTGLANLLAEWRSPAALYADRVTHLTGTPGGLNNGTYLAAGVTAFDDGAKDVLTGAAGSDFFVAGATDVTDVKVPEMKLTV